MITVVSATNRENSRTMDVARAYGQALTESGQEWQLLDMRMLPRDFLFDDFYGKRSPQFQEIVDQFVAAADKMVFVIPEYNGSYPGILKAFLDGVHPRLIRDKKAGIIGVSDGHAGNLRGQEHLTGVLHYLKVHVHYNKPKVSNVEQLFDDQNQLKDERTAKIFREHAMAMQAF